MKRLTFVFILSILIIAGSTSSVIAQSSQDSETYIIVFDEAHYQYFTSDMMDTALSSLNDSLDTPELDVTVDLVIQTEAFNSTNVQGADLVIIGNPGTDEDGELPDIAESEENALENLIGIGGSVLWMSNPISNNENITANAEPLNDLSGFFDGSVTTGVTGDNNNATVLKDDLNAVGGNSAYIEVGSDNFSDKTLMTELNNITRANGASFVYYGSHLTEVNPLGNYANSSESAYVVNRDFQYRFYQSAPRWMVADDFSNDGGGRAMMVGSTIMFSDYMFDTSTTWINQANNKQLFQNMVAWLLGITPVPDIQDIVTQPFETFIGLNILYAAVISFVAAAVVLYMFISSGRLQVSQIFDIFTEKTKKSGSTSDARASDKPTTTKSPSKTKRRKRV